MNEEEKKAVEEFKKQLRLAMNIDDIATTIRNGYAQIILDMIEKLQKENEELKENNKYIINLTDEQYNAVIENAQDDIKQKWVQKVKDKIEELEEQYNVRELDFIKTTQDIRKIIIQSLEELIEGKK